MNFALPLACFFLALSACNTSKNLTDKAVSFDKIELRQGGCFGTCPIYTMEVMPNGEATYNGKRYAPFQSLHTGKVAGDSLKKMQREVGVVLEKADALPRQIESGIADMAMSTIVIYSKGDTMTFRGTSEFAEPVGKLRNTLLSIANNTGWSRSPDAEPLPANQLLVTLQAADQIQVITEDFYRQQLKMVRLVQKPATFLLSFDPYTMSAQEMERDLLKKKMVQKVVIVENE